MKKQLTAFMALTIVICAQAQDIYQSDVPSLVLNKFNSQFSKARDLEWELDGAFYRVEFETGWGTDHTVWYTAEGDQKRHEEDLSSSDLPQKVKESLAKNFTSHSIDNIEKVTTPEGVTFTVELDSFTRQDWGVVLDEQGNILSKRVAD